MDPLQQAIRHAIKQMPVATVRRPSQARESLVKLAADAQAFVEETRTAMAAGAGGPRTERRVVAGALLAYALDIAWSVCHLLRTEPVRTHIVVLTLWRPLLETWLRAAFFALEATDEEITVFRTEGKLPKRGWPSRPDSKTDLTPRLIAKLIAPSICPEQPELIGSLADEVKDWHGFVHGGEVIVDLFDGGDTLQSQVGPDHMAFKVQRVAVVAFLTGMVGLNLSTDERQREELDPLGAALSEKIRAFQRRWPHRPPAGEALPEVAPGTIARD